MNNSLLYHNDKGINTVKLLIPIFGLILKVHV